jgi:predicted AlkP superfamily phosphohydrolase/phosphomutase
MPQETSHRLLSHRLFSGLVAGVIVGILLGFIIGYYLILVNGSLHTAFLRSDLRLHFAALYGLLLIIPGLIVGLIALGRRRGIGMVAQGILIVFALVLFYYGRNKLSIRLWSHFGNIQWLMEILGGLVWAVICWLVYRFLLFLEKHVKGWTVRIALILVIVLVGWNLIQLLWVPSAKKMPPPPALPAPNPNIKVALIGLDGAWWEVIDPLIEAGRLPHFKSLIDHGVRAPFQTFKPTQSPLIWTTIATGKMPNKHFITSYRVWTFPITGTVLPLTQAPGSLFELYWMLGKVIRVTPINSTFRMSEAVWNILSEAGLSVGVLNWWASYPAEPVNGYDVTDHALYNKAMQVVMGDKFHGDTRSIFPPQLIPELEPLVVDPMNIPPDSVARFIHFQSVQDQETYANTKDYQTFRRDCPVAMFKFSYPEDVTMVRAALHLLKTRPQPDFFAIYLDGLDSMQHWYLPYYFWIQHQDVLTPENIARFKDLVPEYYVYLDGVLGQFLSVLDSNTVIIIVSDHGFDHGLQRHNLIYDHLKAPPGVFIISGDGIKQDTLISNVSVRDITPTILYLFGLPIGKDMDGRAVTEVVSQEPTPVSYVDTYDTKNRGRGRMESSQMDKAILEKLRALGYFK